MTKTENKIMQFTGRAAALALSAVLTLGMSGASIRADEGDSLYPPKEHADLDFSEMTYTGTDGAETERLLQELSDLTNKKTEADDPEKRTVELYEEILAEIGRQYTQYTLGDLEHYRDVTDEAMSESVVNDTVLMQDLSDKAILGLKEALNGPYGDLLWDCFTDQQLEDIQEYEALTDKERELTEKETDLEQQYDRVSEEEYTFDYKGRTWTMDLLYDETPEDYDDVVAIYLGLAKAQNEAAVPIYQEMVKVRKEIAELEGYDSYIDYAYDVIYGRDFTGEDIAALRETVINELVPLYNVLDTELYYEYFDTDLQETVSGEEIVETLAPYMEKVAPELMEAYNYLQDHHLYYIDNTTTMVDAGFTADLPEYGSGYIYYKTGGTIRDYETIVHEFGHFNATYHAPQNVLMDSLLVDVAEIQSQGLEMLFMDYMKEILDDDSTGLQLYLVVNMLDSVITGFEFDEFQQEVYSRDEMTVDELNELAWEIDSKYTEYFFEDDGKAYEWTGINHTFTSPLYYIGYATSALSALDIWTQSLEDRDAAVDKYLQLSAVPLDMPYQEATTSCGLNNMLKAENITALRDDILRWSDGIGLPYTLTPDEDSEEMEDIPDDLEEQLEELQEEMQGILPQEEPEEEYEYYGSDDTLEELEETFSPAISLSRIINLVRVAVSIIILILYFGHKKKFERQNRNIGNDPRNGNGGGDPPGWY